ncbi:MAG TPA: class I SAM-dependent methyltransferase [Candidatus Binatia bacterium]|jgi:cyclopropane fatty-acyl-phospholipid synthase-like methyltransferase
MPKLRRSSLIFLFLNLAVAGFAAGPADEVPFWPTPVAVVDQMLEIAEVKPGDVVYDLGSGDGRIVIRAAEKYGARGVGVELDSWLVESARVEAKARGVDKLVEFHNEDAAKVDLRGATVVTLYMLPWFNDAMKQKFRAELKPGARIVSHDYAITGWPADSVERSPVVEQRAPGFKHEHTIYLWRVR